MKRIAFKFNRGVMAAVAAIVLAFGANAQAANIDTGYTQNFDSMGTSGASTLPTDWSALYFTGGHGDWNQTTGIPTGVVGGGSATTVGSAIVDTSIVAGTKGNPAYNIAHAATPTDRVLATSPTGTAGNGIQLLLTNNLSSSISNVNISYDIVKFYDGTKQSSIDPNYPTGEELPGYQLFYKVDGVNTWYNVAALNPVTTTDGVHPVVPVGTVNNNGVNGPVDYNVTHVNANITLAQAVAAGQTLTFRWIDDNAVNISNDQVIGLDNVAVTPTPIPAAAWLLGSGLMGLVGLRRKGQK